MAFHGFRAGPKSESRRTLPKCPTLPVARGNHRTGQPLAPFARAWTERSEVRTTRTERPPAQSGIEVSPLLSLLPRPIPHSPIGALGPRWNRRRPNLCRAEHIFEQGARF